MKTTNAITILCCLLFATAAATDIQPVKPATDLPLVLRQDTIREDSTQIFGPRQKMPQFPGGEKALMAFLRENIHYPDTFLGTGQSCRVICTFIITETGKIVDPEVIRGFHPAMDSEALRLIRSMPDWSPAEERGKKVKTKFTLPIRFADPTTSTPPKEKP